MSLVTKGRVALAKINSNDMICWKTTKTITLFTIAFLVINKIYPLNNFIKVIVPIVGAISWCAFILFFIIYLVSLKIERSISGLVLDEAQAKRAFDLFQSKCKYRKALMISAPWGAGKTTFYRASLRSKFIESLHKKYIVEISCFGLSSQNDLIMQILNELFYIKWVSILSNYVAQIASGSSEFKRALIPKDLILCIDDFERFSGNPIELIGLFDYLIQKKKCHVIILCNAEKIKPAQKSDLSDFLEKSVVKFSFEMSSDIRKAIMMLPNFHFNNKSFTFKEDVIDHFEKILESTKNLRAAHEAIMDLVYISEHLSNKLVNINISEEKKEERLSIYFENGCYSVIKAAFIKSMHKEDEYFELKEAFDEYLKNLGNGRPNFTIKDEFLSKLGSISLAADDLCTSKHGLLLPESMISYLKGVWLFDEDFLNEIIRDFILIPDIRESILTYQESVMLPAGKNTLKESFFNFFKFIELLPSTPNNCYIFVAYKVAHLKFNFSVSQEENILINSLEDKFTRSEICEQIANMLAKRGDHPSELIFKMDPEQNILNQLCKEYCEDNEKET